jgi:sarcosine oxidase subunit alpha
MAQDQWMVGATDAPDADLARDLGLGRMVSDKKDSIGAVLSRREVLVAEGRQRLVGLKAAAEDAPLTAGAHLLPEGGPVDSAHALGYITSTCFSPTLGHHIALALVAGGETRMGETLRLASPVTGHETTVTVVSPHFLDPEGERLRA